MTKSQFNTIKESIAVAVKSGENTASSFAQASTNPDTIKDVEKAKQVTGDVDLKISGPKSDDTKPVIDVDVPNGSSFQKEINNNADISRSINNGSSVYLHGDGICTESKTFKKSELEEIRLKNLQNDSVLMSKEQLKESMSKNNKTVSWTPNDISMIYSNIEEFPKNSIEFGAVRAAIFEVTNKKKNNYILKEETFPSIIYKDGEYYANGKNTPINYTDKN